MANETNLAALIARIKFFNTLFFTLFFASIGVLVLQQTTFGRTPLTMIAWVVTLGAALAVRLYRRKLVKEYNLAVPSAPMKRPRAKKR